MTSAISTGPQMIGCIMEGRGRGWPRIRRAMREHDGLVPRLEEDRGARWVRVTLPVAPAASAS